MRNNSAARIHVLTCSPIYGHWLISSPSPLLTTAMLSSQVKDFVSIAVKVDQQTPKIPPKWADSGCGGVLSNAVILLCSMVLCAL